MTFRVWNEGDPEPTSSVPLTRADLPVGTRVALIAYPDETGRVVEATPEAVAEARVNGGYDDTDEEWRNVPPNPPEVLVAWDGSSELSAGLDWAMCSELMVISCGSRADITHAAHY